MMTDYEILHEILSDCFWTGVSAGENYDDQDRVVIQAAVTVPAKIQELLEKLGLGMIDGNLGESEK